MAASSLKRYSVLAFTANTTTDITTTVPANRALVVSKITVSNTSGAATTFRLFIGGTAIAYDTPLAAGQVYTETGLVVATGEKVQAYFSTTNGGHVQVFGEEVDNT